MNTNKKGDIGLIKAMMDLTLKGYFVFTPISDTTCVDLVVGDENMNLKRIQIKYSKLTNGRMSICTSTVVNGKKVPIDLTKIDIWAIYCPDNDNVYYIPTTDLIGKKNMFLRVVESEVKNSRIIMADKYLTI